MQKERKRWIVTNREKEYISVHWCYRTFCWQKQTKMSLSFSSWFGRISTNIGWGGAGQESKFIAFLFKIRMTQNCIVHTHVCVWLHEPGRNATSAIFINMDYVWGSWYGKIR